MTADEQQANYAKQQAQLAAALAARQAATADVASNPNFSGEYDANGNPLDYDGNILPGRAVPAQTLTQDQALLSSQLEDQNAAALQGLKEGAAEGLNNVLNAPGWLVGVVGEKTGQALWGVLKNIPWWVYLVGLGGIFVWMGGLSLLRGRFARSNA